jgi:hypothetical protein
VPRRHAGPRDRRPHRRAPGFPLLGRRGGPLLQLLHARLIFGPQSFHLGLLGASQFETGKLIENTEAELDVR